MLSDHLPWAVTTIVLILYGVRAYFVGGWSIHVGGELIRRQGLPGFLAMVPALTLPVVIVVVGVVLTAKAFDEGGVWRPQAMAGAVSGGALLLVVWAT